MVDVDPLPLMRPKTICYMAELAEASFERQAELNESIWRSLPFFAATLGLGAAIIGRAAADVPMAGGDPYRIATSSLLGGSTLAFIWALWWFWDVVRGRDYEIPASDDRIRDYAERMTAFHEAQGLGGGALDAKVVEEIRLFMIDQYGEAARANFQSNAARTQSRSQVLLFMMVGFVLAFACEGIIFAHRSVYAPATGAVSDDNNPLPSSNATAAAAGAPKGSSRDRGSVFRQIDVGPANPGKVINERAGQAGRKTCRCSGDVAPRAATSSNSDESRTPRCAQFAKTAAC